MGCFAIVSLILTGLWWLAAIVAYLLFAVVIKRNTAKKDHTHTKYIFIAYGLGLFIFPLGIAAIVYSFFLPDELLRLVSKEEVPESRE